MCTKQLKIYFCGSIMGGRQDAQIYNRLIGKLQEYGTVLTEHVGALENVTSAFKLKASEASDTISKAQGDMSYSEWVHQRDMAWLEQCDIVVAEVTQPSLGVGYEIGRAVALGKKIVCLFRPSSERRLSAMIDGIPRSDKYDVKHYEEPQALDIIDEIFAAKK